MSLEPLSVVPFARAFFSALRESSPTPITLVLDAYEAVPADSPLHGAICAACQEASDGFAMVVTSRVGLPDPFAALHAGGRVTSLEGGDLRFTLEETRLLLRARARRARPSTPAGARGAGLALSEAVIRRVHARARGWAAGLVLLLESVRHGNAGVREVGGSPDHVFDYFAEEIIARLEPKMRALLVSTALLPRLTPTAAARLTGEARAGQMLEKLARDGLFTQRHAGPQPVYQYHPLFREFLLARARGDLGRKELARLRRAAARLLEEEGQLEDAAGLLAEACDWRGLASLVKARAPAWATQGRVATIGAWIAALPARQVERDGWLLFWRATSIAGSDPRSSIREFERAHSRFAASRDSEGIMQSILGCASACLYAFDDMTILDSWIRRLERRLGRKLLVDGGPIDGRIVVCMGMALVFRKLQHPDLPVWRERALEVMRRGSEDVNLRVMAGSCVVLCDSYLGDCDFAFSVVEELRPLLASAELSAASRITWHLMLAQSAWVTARFDVCSRAVDEALQVSRKTGVRYVNANLLAFEVYASLTRGDTARAAVFLEKLSAAIDFGMLLQAGLYHHLAGMLEVNRGNPNAALVELRAAARLVDRAGMPFARNQCRLALALGLGYAGDRRGARRHLAEAHRIAVSARSASGEFPCLLAEAHFALEEGDARAAQRWLRRAMALGRRWNYLNIYGLLKEDTARLCAESLRAGIETEYVLRLVRAHGLVPRDPPQDVAAWPFSLRVRLLGGLEIAKDGRPLELRGKASRKPLALFQALAAAGPAGAPQQRLGDALWPAADGDLSRASLDTTLHRLRKLLGDESAVQVSDGRVALDPRVCRVDAWAFERLCARLDPRGVRDRRRLDQEELRAATEALSLYAGPFLPGEDGFGIAAYRERLRVLFVRLATLVAEHWCGLGEDAKGLAVLQGAVAADEVAEELHRQVISWHLRLGQRGESLAAYERCRNALAAGLGAEPSPATEALRRSVSGELGTRE